MADLYPNGLQYYAASVGAAGIALNDNFGLLDPLVPYNSLTATPTELDYMAGVTSAVQTQINGKMSDLLDDTTPELGGTLTADQDIQMGQDYFFYIGYPDSSSEWITYDSMDSYGYGAGAVILNNSYTLAWQGGGHLYLGQNDFYIKNASGGNMMHFRTSINRLALGGTGTSLIEVNDDLDYQSNDIYGTGGIGVGTGSAPTTRLHVYENNTNADTSAGITIEQAGTGDAMLHWLLTAAKQVTLGLDNSNSDQLVLNDSGNDVLVANTSSGYFGINRNPAATIDIDGGSVGSTTRTDLRFTTDFAFGNYAQGTGIEWWGGGSSLSMATIRGTAMSADQVALTFSTYNTGASALKTGLFIAEDQTVGIGTYFGDTNGYYPDGQLHVYSDHTGTTKTMQVWDWDSASPADNDTMYFDYYGQSDLGNRHTYAQQRLKFIDVTDGSEDAEWELYLSSNGILQEVLNIHVTNGFTINAPGPTILTGMTVNTKETTGNTPTTTLKSNAATTGTVASGFGTAWEIDLENSSGSTHAAGSLGIRWTDPTNLSEDSEWFLKLYSGGVEVEAASINDLGNLTLLGTLTTGGSGSGQSTFPQGLVVNDDGGSAAADNFRAETANVTDALEVDAANDKVVINVPLQVEYRASAPGTLVNGMVWMESDGLHIYYNSAEKVVAGV